VDKEAARTLLSLPVPFIFFPVLSLSAPWRTLARRPTSIAAVPRRPEQIEQRREHRRVVLILCTAGIGAGRRLSPSIPVLFLSGRRVLDVDSATVGHRLASSSTPVSSG
jgi:hypothetical protein